MTTEQGLVLRADASTAWIVTQKTGACEACTARKYCNTMGGGQEMEVAAMNLAGARSGDRVVVGFDTSSLIKAAFLLYVVPVFGMMAGAAGGVFAAGRLGMNESAWAALAGFAALCATFVFVRRTGNRLAEQTAYRPKVIRIIGAAPEPAACDSV